MSKRKCIVRQIRDYGQNKGEVYSFINIIEKKVYVGETGNGESREWTHAKCIFGLESSGSNNNLIDENQENSYCLLYLYSFQDKESDERFWIAMETIYMYLFVKHGFRLYNSNKGTGRDNVGATRKFLLDNISEQELYQNVLSFLKDYTVSAEYEDERTGQEFSVTNWEEFLVVAEKVFLNDITNIFGENIFELENDKKRCDFWNRFLSQSRSDENFIVLEEMKNPKDFFVFNKEKLKSISQDRNLEEISVKELVEQNHLDRIIYSKAGDYLGETIYEILSNKFADLQEKYNPFEQKEADKGMCFWSVAGDQQDWLRSILSSDKKEDVYILLFYTGSKNLSAKTADEFNAVSFSLKRKRDKKYPYPTEFVPELVSNRNNMAFLISDFYYPKEEISTEIIEGAYTAIYEQVYSDSRPIHISEGVKQKTFYVGELQNGDREILINQLKTANCDRNNTRMILAKLQYPYVVALHK